MLKSLQPDAAKAEAYFERSLSVAREQKAKSWGLRAAMSLARLWRDQGKVQQARELSGTTGPLKALTRAICRKPRNCSMNCMPNNVIYDPHNEAAP